MRTHPVSTLAPLPMMRVIPGGCATPLTRFSETAEELALDDLFLPPEDLQPILGGPVKTAY